MLHDKLHYIIQKDYDIDNMVHDFYDLRNPDEKVILKMNDEALLQLFNRKYITNKHVLSDLHNIKN